MNSSAPRLASAITALRARFRSRLAVGSLAKARIERQNRRSIHALLLPEKVGLKLHSVRGISVVYMGFALRFGPSPGPSLVAISGSHYFQCRFSTGSDPQELADIAIVVRLSAGSPCCGAAFLRHPVAYITVPTGSDNP